jgi:hypothetical protein
VEIDDGQSSSRYVHERSDELLCVDGWRNDGIIARQLKNWKDDDQEE